MLQDQLAKELGISKGYLSKLIAKGCPADDVGKAKNWISGNVKGKVGCRLSASDPSSKEIPPAESPLPDESFTWEARLARARKVEVDVYNASQAALGRKEYVSLQSLLSTYTKSIQSIAEAEKTALDARIKAGELIHRDTARAILVELLQPIRNALDLLPMTERSRCNPADPKTAENVLRAWKDALLLRLSQAETKF